ncbi:ABC1-domain-containing protein [Atractiella rhizophila]|nr:ABC1-domain-containing protein [Atractiella rhizophila]
MRVATRRLLYAAGGGTGFYAWDRYYGHERFRRTGRVLWFGLVTTLDFKLNFKADMNARDLEKLHERVAARIYNLCTSNAGLFIKLGQAIATQASVLPKPYRIALANIFDNVPSIADNEVGNVFRKEFGVGPEEAFEIFDPTPIASASIAQVHKAKLKDEDGGDWVAVKVQKPAIKKQLELDILSYKGLMWAFEWWFEMPAYFIADYMSKQLRTETNFVQEAKNAELTAQMLASESTLSGRVIVPKVHWKWTRETIMTAEWIADAVRINEREKLEEMSFSLEDVVQPTLDAFGALIFRYGHCHADPHPGNILIRRHPQNRRKPQIVIVDHGLYTDFPEPLRQQYGEFWRSLFTGDMKSVEDISTSWGIGNADMFASMTVLRPHKLNHGQKGEARSDTSQASPMDAKSILKNLLQKEQLFPRELLLVGRAMRLLQGINQSLGSPSNRVNIFAEWAFASDIQSTTSLRKLGIGSYLHRQTQLFTFRLTSLLFDLAFWLTRMRQRFWISSEKRKQEGFEDILERRMQAMAKTQFGVELDESAWSG